MRQTCGHGLLSRFAAFLFGDGRGYRCKAGDVMRIPRPVLPSASSEALGQVPGGSGLGVNAEDHGSWPVDDMVSIKGG